jgi:hypothetical protein
MLFFPNVFPLMLFFPKIVTHLSYQDIVIGAKTSLRRLIFVRELLHVFVGYVSRRNASVYSLAYSKH